MTNFQERLFTLQDLSYRDFQAKLIPTLDPEIVIGVRTPALRKLARELAKEEDVQPFLDALPHRYYDENNLHAFLIELCKDFDRTIALLDAFLPFVDNWATCDLCSPKCFAKHLPALFPHIQRWIASGQTYTIRFGLETLMRYYLESAFQPSYLELAASVRSEEYYVKMMVAWFFATALAKQFDAALPYLTERRLEEWTLNKTIQKAVESNRIDPERKKYLKTLKICLPKG